jgi:DNA helicase TIP49 (TBP-interacting protein)
MPTTQPAYTRRRIEEERAAIRNASSESVARIHAELAIRYASELLSVCPIMPASPRVSQVRD